MLSGVQGHTQAPAKGFRHDMVCHTVQFRLHILGFIDAAGRRHGRVSAYLISQRH